MLVRHQHKQWDFCTEDDGSYEMLNRGPNGERRYFMVKSGRYGEPITVGEPDLALEVPPGCAIVDRRGAPQALDQKIAGIICRGASDEVELRLSLTNAKDKGIGWALHRDGRLEVNGTTYYLRALVLKDANRVENYDAFFGASPPADGKVRFYELEDLPV